MSHSHTNLLSIALVLSGLGLTGAAAAQDATAAEAAPMPEAQAAEPVDEPEVSTSRFRWGISGAGGPLMGGYSGGAGGIDARFGWQFDSLFGLYAQPMFLLGAGASADVDGASATGMALFGVGALADATLGDLFYVAAGPELLFGAIGEASASSTSASASGAEGPFFSLAARAGFAFGSKRPDRRSAFTVGLHLHTVFANEAAILPLVALGYESF